jgi:hypothetical protein
MDINRYKQIAKNEIRVRYNIDVIIPSPSNKDYVRGYIKRYFVQKVNDKGSPIYEVSSSTKNYYNTKPQFITTQLKWRISGPIEQTYDASGTVIDKSVSESNRIAIKLVSDKIPNLKLYLPNLLQFYKNK